MEDSRENTRTRGQRFCRRNKERVVNLTFEKIFDKRKVEALYLWFVFMNQLEMAKYLCSRSQVRQTICSLSIYFVI
jgi:hypothetical protein